MYTFLKMTILFFLVNLSTLKTEKIEFFSTVGDPVPGIDVSLEQIPGGKIVTTITDTQGNYSFKDITEGKYILHFGKMKYSLDGSDDKKLRSPDLTHVRQPNASSQINDKIGNEQKPNITNEKSRFALGKSTSQQKLNNNSGDIVIYGKNYNSSRSNVSQFESKSGETIPLINTVLTDPKIDLLKENVKIEIEISKSIKILKGNLTK